MLHVKKLLTLFGFSFHKHCSLSYFCCHPLANLHSRLVERNTTVYYGGLPTLIVLCCICRRQCMTVQTSSHSDPMESSEYFMFGEICSCLGVFGDIDKPDLTFILDLIICPLGNFSFIIFFVRHTLFR